MAYQCSWIYDSGKLVNGSRVALSSTWRCILQMGVKFEQSYPYAAVNGDVCGGNGNPQKLLAGYAVISPMDVNGIMQAIYENGAVVSIVEVMTV